MCAPAVGLAQRTDTEGDFECGPCPVGYMHTTKTQCRDIDECEFENGDCDPLVTCTNTLGAHTCGPCPEGYEGAGETGCILLVNECLTDHGGCSADAACTDTRDGRTCACHDGYAGDGVNCDDKDECAVGTDTCDALVA